MPGDFVWLENHQFRRYGSWKPGGGKLQRGDLGRKIPGLYAFVVDGLVQYIGKAETHLRGRVRNYNRCLIDNPLRPHRDAHGGIARALKEGKTVDVYIRIATAGDNVSALETTWIRELNPVWNKT